MVLTEEAQKEARRIKERLKRKGVKIIDDTRSRIKKPEVKVKKPKPHYNNQSTSKVDPSKFKEFHYYLQDSGFLIDSDISLKFNIEEEEPIDDAGECTIKLAKEAYNPNLTFTIITALLQNTSLISFGPPGSGKTSASEFVISGMYNIPMSEIQEATIQGNPELTEEKMLAYISLSSFIDHKEKIGVRKFMTSPGRIIDEVNRMPPSKSSLLLRILDNGWATYNDKKIKATQGPLFATANGIDPGTYEMTPPFLDRFDIGIIKAELDPYFIEFYTSSRNNKIRSLEDKIIQPPRSITSEDIMNARKEIYFNTYIESELMNKVAHFLAESLSCDKAGKDIQRKTKGHAMKKSPGPLCKDCRYYNNDMNICKETGNGLGARTISSLYAYSKALSWWRGNQKVEEDDIKYALMYT
ncbi:AAA domain-containing protein, partial [Candidatus Woesearchaeota archaeon]|nr:AAA domain-containing protein [Candidatus Woesearchaeota archaeon]